MSKHWDLTYRFLLWLPFYLCHMILTFPHIFIMRNWQKNIIFSCVWFCETSFHFNSGFFSNVLIFELVVQFPARGSTQVLLCLFPGVLLLWHFPYSVGPHPVSSFHIYLLLCSGHSWRVRLAKQETLTPPGHLVSTLVCRGPWMSTVVLYCWCHSDMHQFFCILH